MMGHAAFYAPDFVATRDAREGVAGGFADG